MIYSGTHYPSNWVRNPFAQPPAFCCGFLYSVLVTDSESRYLSGSAAICLIASASVAVSSTLTTQDFVILKYFTCTTPSLSGNSAAPGCQPEAGNQSTEELLFLRYIEKCSLLTDADTAFEKDTCKRPAADIHQNLIHHSSPRRIAVQE